MFKKMAAVMFCLLALLALSPSAYAVWTDNGLPLGDYLSRWEIDSVTNEKQMYFDFSSINFRQSYIWVDENLVYTTRAPNSGYTANKWSIVAWRHYPLGSHIAYNQPLFSGDNLVYFDVRDVTFGTGVDVQVDWCLDYTYAGSVLNWRSICGLYCYDSSGSFIDWIYVDREGVLETGGRFTLNLDCSKAASFSSKVCYIVPYFEFLVKTNSGEQTTTSLGLSWSDISFALRVDLDLVAENSLLQNAIYDKLGDIEDELGDVNDKLEDTNDKLDDTNDKLDDTNDKLDDTNDKLDDILKQPEQEKQEAGSSGNSNIDSVTGAIPDYSEGFVSALQSLATAMSYDGTEAVLKIPAVDVPGIGGLFAGFRMMESTSFDFGVYIKMLPASLLLLVQSLLTIALIVYCFKELYSVISYFLTLKGGVD